MAELYSNLALTTTTSAIDASQTTIPVSSAAAFPATGNFRITIDQEIMIVTSVSGNTFTVTRGAESTTATTHLLGVAVGHGITAGSLDAIVRQIVSAANWKPYPVFTPGAYDDEFDDANFSGWTVVQPSSPHVTVTEYGSNLSVYHPGQGTAYLMAFMKAYTPTVGDYIEFCFRNQGVSQNYNQAGLLFADGATQGAGQQVSFHYSPNESVWIASYPTNYIGVGSGSNWTHQAHNKDPFMFMRWKYQAANTFVGYVSCDGCSWANLTGNLSYTLSPTYIGFYCTTWTGTSPTTFNFEYFKKGP